MLGGWVRFRAYGLPPDRRTVTGPPSLLDEVVPTYDLHCAVGHVRLIDFVPVVRAIRVRVLEGDVNAQHAEGLHEDALRYLPYDERDHHGAQNPLPS